MGFMSGAAFDTPFWSSADPSGRFEVEDIHNHHLGHSGIKYLMKWLVYPVVEATWEPLSNLTNCPDILSAYEGCKGLSLTQGGG